MSRNPDTPEGDPTFRPNPQIGQHILMDEGVIGQTVSLVPQGASCVEIGPGPGTITKHLLANGSRVTAYEVDERCEVPLGRLTPQKNLTVHWKSILDAPDDEVNGNDDEYHLVGNIPFHITEPLFRKMGNLGFRSAVLLVGDNASQAVTAPHPDHTSWSRMSLVSQAYFDTTVVADVPRTSFDPVPRTDAALIQQTRKDATPAWRRDVLVRSYRALVEADNTHSTVASALSTISIDSEGNAARGGQNRGKKEGHRSERREDRRSLRNYTDELNTGGDSARPPRLPFENLLNVVSPKVGEVILSRPMGELNNQDLRRLCGTISTAVNRRKSSR
jgi:16S rRNA (adenine1518-N6/adenine1519-N6)-dimethyltransferase